MGRRKPCIDLLGQLAQGALYVVQVFLLMRLKPRPLIVKAYPPEKVIGLLGKSLKHVYPSYLLRL